ncbi:MAG: hypothetical protein ACRC8W_22535 [Plesiomonas shigelloides]
MNTYTDKHGIEYAAIPSITVDSCDGCVHALSDQGCIKVPHCCAAEDRDDGRDVVWVHADNFVDPVSIELTFAATDRIDAVRNTVARLRAVYEPHFTVGKTEITRRGDHIIVSIPVGVRK